MSRHRRRTRSRSAASALVAAGLLVVASACSAGGGGAQDVATGPGTGSTTGIAYLNQAAAATNEVQTFKVAVTTTLSGVGGNDEVSATGTGEVDRAGRRAHLDVDLGDTLGSASDELPEGAGSLELVVDGDTAYLRSPLYAGLTGSDAEWVSASTADLAAEGPGSTTGQGDPGGLLALLEGSGGPLEERGREDVRGVPTRHVATVIDVEKALAQLPDDRNREAVEALRAYGAEASSYVTIPAEAWVDDDGHVRRLRVDLDFSKAADEVPELAGASVSITVELFDFDAPVDIAVPDPADVAELDLGALLGGD